MKCPFCGFAESKVIDSRTVSDGVRRRRECLECASRFTTYERVQTAGMLVVKKDGRREEFNREKLISGIRKACAKRPVSNETIEAMVDEIEMGLHRLGQAEVPSTAIGDMVMGKLRQLDGVAYIRFASVYRAFADVEEVKRELDAYESLRLGGDGSAQLPLFQAPEAPRLVISRPRGNGRKSKRLPPRQAAGNE